MVSTRKCQPLQVVIFLPDTTSHIQWVSRSTADKPLVQAPVEAESDDEDAALVEAIRSEQDEEDADDIEPVVKWH